MIAPKQLSVIKVQFCRGKEIIPMGRLAIKDRKIFFEYDAHFLESGLQLSPFKLPLKSGVIGCDDRLFDGLFGVFNDSLPDGWGRLLLDRKLMKKGFNPAALTPLDRLRYVGTRGMGALQYVPEMEEHADIKLIEDLDAIAEECVQVFDETSDTYVEDLFELNGSSAGARPKILVRLSNKNECMEISDANPKAHHNDWIVKFRSSVDPKDIGPIEYAYHMMAKESGLEVPEARLFKSKKCGGYFGVKRFDRVENGFLHMHTAGGLLHADYRLPSLDYEMLMKATLWLTKDVRECEKQFRNAVFNVYAHNRDDHAKNFTFLMLPNGVWTVSPAYDLTFSSGPGGEHSSAIMGEGKNPTEAHLMKLAKVAEIKPPRAKEIIDTVKTAVDKWTTFADMAHVTQKSINHIEKVLRGLNR